MNIMQNLPKKYIDKIINIFGEEGKEWLNNLDRIIEDNAKKYGLNDLKLVNNLEIWDRVLFLHCHFLSNYAMRFS